MHRVGRQFYTRAHRAFKRDLFRSKASKVTQDLLIKHSNKQTRLEFDLKLTGI